MRELEERMRHDGAVRPSNVLKVDSFLNHGCDMQLYQHMADEWARRLAGEKVDKVLTIETSGIGLACVTALALGCPTVVFARKKESQNLQGSQWRTSVHSYTHNRDYTVVVEKKLLNPNERIVIVDDFLANGSAAEGLLDLCKQAHAEVVAMCFAIEKSSNRAEISYANRAFVWNHSHVLAQWMLQQVKLHLSLMRARHRWQKPLQCPAPSSVTRLPWMLREASSPYCNLFAI